MAKKPAFSGSGQTVARMQKKRSSNNKGAQQEQKRQPMIRAMVWYRQEHYLELRKIFADGDQLPVTFDQWLSRAEKKKEEVESIGDQVIKVYIDPETFPQWCREKNIPMDADSRSRLAIEVAQAQSFQM
ncbi:hypothetical protein [Desulforhopalus singaporensis]|uniref:Uncharacterized protein n=1 Tax=Desulforhopalus singaporensis TaxID=91360 RepID=A0A1H0QBV6_9BACT|nr:hypothetical protein [Desulforhopalus singaporensis]SDP14817.1 hypothetical protein SAMN05660330_01937 [Desulforhopalus singaporensis]